MALVCVLSLNCVSSSDGRGKNLVPLSKKILAHILVLVMESASKSYIIMHMDIRSSQDDLLFDYPCGLLVYVTIIVDEHVVILYLHHSFFMDQGTHGV